ncbi:MAG: insulinase family protein [Caldilineaceae bacterium]|nr:insulinase family protein [Caldilineaceae bacterium]
MSVRIAARLSLCTLAVLTLWLALLPPVSSQRALALDSIRDDITVTSLDNGLTVILAPKDGAPVATVNAWIGVGSVHEPPEHNGIAHFFEHMIFYGSEEYAGTVDAVIEGWGGTSNASTSFDWTQYYITVPSEHVEDAVAMLADMLINGHYTEQDLMSERDVVLREGDQRNDDPDSYLAYQSWEAFYDDHPYGQPILGTTETVSSITLETFEEWLDTYYVPNNMTVIVAGDFDPDAALQAVDDAFGGMEPRELPEFNPPELAPRTAIETLEIARDIEQERMRLMWRGPEAQDLDDQIALDVLLYVLSGGRSSRIYRDIVRDLGVVTSADAGYFTTQLPSIFQLSAQYPPERAGVVRAALLDQMERVLDGDLTEEEVETAKTVLIAQWDRSAERSRSIASTLGFYATVMGQPNFAFEYLDRIRTITADDIVRMARKYVDLGSQLEIRMVPMDAEMPTADTSEDLMVLDNGLRLILRQNTTTNVVAFQTFVGTGTSVETAANSGISTFTNALLLRGTEDQTEEEIFLDIENLGATLGQSQLPDMANVTLVATADTWTEAFPIYVDVLTRPAFTEEEFNRLKTERLLDLEASLDDKFGVIYDQLLAGLYGDSGYGSPELGTLETIEALTLSSVREFHSRYYVPENMVISVTGNVDPQLLALRLESAFESLAGTGDPIEHGSRTIDLATTIEPTVARPDANLAWIVMGYPAPGVGDDDYAIMKVINSIVGSGAASRMFTTLREEQGLAYSTGSFFPSRSGTSHVALYAIVLPEDKEATIAGIRAILQDVAENGVEQDELDLAVNREIGSFIRRRETSSSRAFDIGWYEMLGAGIQLDAEYPDRLRAVTAEDVQRVAADYFNRFHVVSVLEPEASE